VKEDPRSIRDSGRVLLLEIGGGIQRKKTAFLEEKQRLTVGGGGGGKKKSGGGGVRSILPRREEHSKQLSGCVTEGT